MDKAISFGEIAKIRVRSERGNRQYHLGAPLLMDDSEVNNPQWSQALIYPCIGTK